MLHDSGRDISQALVAHPQICAVGFTGSRGAGTAFMAIAAARRQPIPVYAEMSSINPVLLLPNALAQRAKAIGKALVDSLTLGAGQFCTNPGLIFALEGEGLDEFLASAAEAIASAPAATMLTSGILGNYCNRLARLAEHSEVSLLAKGGEGGERTGQATLFATTAEAFRTHQELHDEIFGAASLVVICRDEADLEQTLQRLEGQLTIALHLESGDYELARRLMPTLELNAGRLVVNGFGTGVEVAHAMVHGGPFPATSDGRSTSVGSLAIERFLRPICYQSLPDALLPPALQDANPYGIQRMENGVGK